jgi:hypothetical protein
MDFLTRAAGVFSIMSNEYLRLHLRSRGLLLSTILITACIGGIAVCARAETIQQESHSPFVSPRRVRITSSLAEKITRKTVAPREVGAKGDAVLKVLVGEDGKVLSVSSISGDKRLIEAAIPALMQWEFSPYLLNGIALQFETELIVHFKGTKP